MFHPGFPSNGQLGGGGGVPLRKGEADARVLHRDELGMFSSRGDMETLTPAAPTAQQLPPPRAHPGRSDAHTPYTAARMYFPEGG